MDGRVDIERLEERLRLAMLAADVDTLDQLIGDDATFTGQTGVTMGKATDLALHRSGIVSIDRLDAREPPHIRVIGNAGIVTVVVEVSGMHNGEPFCGAFAYTRLWLLRDGSWRIEAAHASAISS